MPEIEILSGQTLGGIAKERRTTIEELLKLNPDITDPNLIYAGAPLVVPEIGEPTKEQLISTSREADEQTRQNQKELEGIVKVGPTAVSPEQPKQPEIPIYDVDIISPEGERQRRSSKDLPALLAQGYKVAPELPAEVLEEETKTSAQIAQDKQIIDLQSQIGTANTQIDQFSADLDAYRTKIGNEAQSLIISIRDIYSARKRAMQEINERSRKAMETIGFRWGTARYSPLLATGILTAEERAGQARLAELDANEAQLIVQAQQAASDKDYKVLNDKMELIREERDKKAETLAKLQTEALKKNEEIEKTKKQSDIDLAIATFVSAGIKDPSQLLSLVKGSTISDVEKSLKAFSANKESTSGANLTADLKTFEYLRDNGMLPEEITSLDKTKQYFAYVDYLKEGNVEGKKITGPTVKIGVGVKDLAEETVVRARLTSKLMNILNKGQLSDSDRAIINENIAILRDAGYAEQEIMDKLSGFAVDVLTPYNEKFRNLIVANTKDNAAQTDQMAKVSLLLNNNDYLQAMKTVENLAMLNAKQTDPDNYLGIATANNYLKIIKGIKDKLATAGIVGFVEGNFQKVLGKLKGKEATQIRADLTRLYSQFRRETAGTAVTENELKFLDPLFADINDRKGNFLTKLDSFERNVKDRYNSARSSVGLPEVNTAEVLDENKRLILYQMSLPSEISARNIIIDYGNDNPAERTLINDMLNNVDPDLGRTLTYDEIYQYLKQLGKIQ